jgi:hypothetical protein
MSKRTFTLRLDYKYDGKFETIAFDTIQADSLIKLLAQFQLLIGIVHKRILTEEGYNDDDDIPF